MLRGIDVSQPCTIFDGLLDDGYGRVYKDGKLHYAHRLAYRGNIPKGYHVHHVCGNRTCVNPAHLEALSPSDHRELHTKPRSLEVTAQRTTCKNGHLLDGHNTRQRFCFTCKREQGRRWAINNRLKGALC